MRLCQPNLPPLNHPNPAELVAHIPKKKSRPNWATKNRVVHSFPRSTAQLISSSARAAPSRPTEGYRALALERERKKGREREREHARTRVGGGKCTKVSMTSEKSHPHSSHIHAHLHSKKQTLTETQTQTQTLTLTRHMRIGTDKQLNEIKDTERGWGMRGREKPDATTKEDQNGKVGNGTRHDVDEEDTEEMPGAFQLESRVQLLWEGSHGKQSTYEISSTHEEKSRPLCVCMCVCVCVCVLAPKRNG